MKKKLYEIGSIITLSVFLALLYNNYAAKPLPIIAETPTTLSNSEIDSLAMTLDKIQAIDQAIKKNETSQKTEVFTEEVKQNSKTITKDIVANNKPNQVVEPIAESKADEVKDAKAKIEKTVTYEQVKEKLNDPRFQIIDARKPEDYKKGKIGNAINIFPYEEEVAYMGRIFGLPRDKVFIIYCNGGTCDLSHKLAEDMIGVGFTKILIYTGGWDEWSKK